MVADHQGRGCRGHVLCIVVVYVVADCRREVVEYGVLLVVLV